MTAEYDSKQIQDFWEKQAKEFGALSDASWSDLWAIELEIRTILEYLNDGDLVADLGCANGYSTLRFATSKQISICGVDYIPDMIVQAGQQLSQVDKTVQDRVSFDVGDIRKLNESDNTYDKVVVTRVVINLGDWETQRQGLLESARILKPGGLLLLSEATVQGWNNMNHFRNEWGLPDIPMPPFNLYLDEHKVVESVSESLALVEILNFSSTYYVGTRILKPLFANMLGTDSINVADPKMDWNRWFAQLPAWGDYGTQKLFVFRKRDASS